jgi:hypothetical protein
LIVRKRFRASAPATPDYIAGSLDVAAVAAILESVATDGLDVVVEGYDDVFTEVFSEIPPCISVPILPPPRSASASTSLSFAYRLIPVGPADASRCRASDLRYLHTTLLSDDAAHPARLSVDENGQPGLAGAVNWKHLLGKLRRTGLKREHPRQELLSSLVSIKQVWKEVVSKRTTLPITSKARETPWNRPIT